MKNILWIGETRMIPGYGMGETNKEKLLPEKLADSFIKQGMAKKVVRKVVNKKEDK